MAGRPKLAKLALDLDARAIELGYESGEEWLLEMIEDGYSTRKLTLYVSEQIGYDVSRPQIQRWGKMDDRYPKVLEARRRSAMNMAEDGGDILDDLATAATQRLVGPGEVSLAKERANHRKYMAGKFDPETFGEKAGVEVNFNLGDLHLQSVTEYSKRAKAISAAATEEIQEAEIIEDDDPIAELLA